MANISGYNVVLENITTESCYGSSNPFHKIFSWKINIENSKKESFSPGFPTYPLNLMTPEGRVETSSLYWQTENRLIESQGRNGT